jgi:type IV pilus assembly protein PilO
MGLSLKIIDRLCLGAVVLLFFLAGYGALKQGFSQRALVTIEKQRIARNMEDTRTAERNIQQLKASGRTVADELRVIYQRIPENPELGEFLKQVDGAMKRRGLVLVSLRPQPVVKEKLYQRIPIHLSCKGPFVNLSGLLEDLEKLERFSVTERLMVGKEEGGACLLDVTIVLFTREPVPITF